MLSNLPAPGSHVVLGWLLPTPAIGMLQPLPYPHAWAWKHWAVLGMVVPIVTPTDS